MLWKNVEEALDRHSKNVENFLDHEEEVLTPDKSSIDADLNGSWKTLVNEFRFLNKKEKFFTFNNVHLVLKS